MVLKNLFRIINDYKFSLISVIFFELLYLIKGYKGNRFDFSTNERMTDNIPCPYYFLIKIKKNLEDNNFLKLLDLGCGSGRTIDFFNKNFPNKEFIGIEYFNKQYEYCKKNFKKHNNIKIIQNDFTKLDFFQYDADCYFFNDPFGNNSDFIKFIENIVKFSLKNKILFIFVNYNKKVIEELKNIKCIESFYISDIKGYSICYLNNN
jgi:SAM-dependent methyltransferase